MDGQTVVCTRDISTLIGTDSLRVAGSPPPPTNVIVTEVGVSTFSITWTEPTSNCGTSFSYDVVSDCGGSCSVSSNTSGICSGWIAPQSCSVMVRANSDLCGGQTGSFSAPVMLNLMEPSPPAAGDVSVLAVYSDDSLDSIMVAFPTSPVEVAPGFSPAVTYSVRIVSDPQMVLTGNCNATLCQYLTNFTSDNPPSNNFTVTITVSNGIGGGQSVITSSQLPFNILSSLATLTVVVIDSNANVTANLSSGFRGSTGLTVTYGITPNTDANTVMSANNGMAGDTLEVILTSLQPNLTYCYSIYLTQGVLLFKVVGVFRSGYFVIPPDNPSLVIVVSISAVVLSFAIGIIVGILLTHFCGICVQGIRRRKCGTLLLVILLIIVFGFGIGILIGYCCVKNKKETQKKKYEGSVEDEDPKGRSEKLTGTEMSSPPPVIYEEILDPLAQENIAYSHVQQLQAPLEQRGPVYEDIKPDPHTQGNLAYGHVQFH
ncbi:uncharacterized protein LOC135344489 isoform X2 [Halichondria panicea]|uniref:uncharacterized protein LOC135344489 isoform X2 n=1 Tax=Halichondria panicea TaxID=6063 RepID=UPI00312BC006